MMHSHRIAAVPEERQNEDKYCHRYICPVHFLPVATLDQEFSDAAMKFLDRSHKEGKPHFVAQRHMHAFLAPVR